ncbi:MAG: DUF2281 domain-containing protein [Methylococcaceae bacterium]|nr:DUF2281 domain-containing protein [Methylococcaceae bacterium]MDP3905341.1 DUF2281 domain-containing protein [Methylococcaceae bacterium]
MNIAETIYQHVKILPTDKALEVLHFIEFLESKTDKAIEPSVNIEMLQFLQSLPIGQRSDVEIDAGFQALRDEWDRP